MSAVVVSYDEYVEYARAAGVQPYSRRAWSDLSQLHSVMLSRVVRRWQQGGAS